MDSATRILIVEDSKFFSHLVRKAVLERIDAEVVVTQSLTKAKAALAAAERPFHLALVGFDLHDCQEGAGVDYVLARALPCIVLTPAYSDGLRARLQALDIIDDVERDSPASLAGLVTLIERLHHNRGLKVLAVDGTEGGRRNLAALLKSHLFQVVEAAEAESALVTLATNPDVRLVITDYALPGFDGLELVQRIRASHDQDRLAVIGISTGGGSALSAKFIKAGANDFINKPFLREEFFCRVMQNIRMLEMVERLTDMAIKDELTGIHNRRFYFDAGESLFASAQRDHVSLTAARIDIDFFNQIGNDFGHEVCDLVLRRVASLLRQRCRQTDIVARVGDEAFAILAVNMNEGSLRPFFEKLRRYVEAEEIFHQGKRIRLSASFGICHGVGTRLDTMFKLANEALSRARQNGSNRVEIA